MDIDSEHLGIPDAPYEVVVKMPSAEFQRICRDISVMSESGLFLFKKSKKNNTLVTIDVIKEGIRFSASGDSGKGSVSLKPTNGSIDDESDKSVSIELNSPVSMTFSLKYLLNFTKATALSESVTLSMTDEVPLLVEYKAHDAGYIRFVSFFYNLTRAQILLGTQDGRRRRGSLNWPPTQKYKKRRLRWK